MRDTAKKTPELRFSGFCGDWEQRKLGELLINLESGVSVNSSEEKTGYYILKTSAIKSGQVDLTEVKSILREEITRAKISIVKNSIIISRMNTPALVGDSALVTENRENIFLPDRLWQGRINNNFSPDWVIQSLNSSSSLRKIQNLATGTSGSMKNISKKFMLDFELKVPKLAEQAKIGSFFKQLDQLIALHQQKLDQLELMKKGFLQQLFPENGEKIPKVRFANFEDEWEQRKLASDLIKNKNKNKELKILNVESVSNKTGFTKQTDQFEGYTVASSDISNYYIIKEKQFAYNPSRINVGSIAYKSPGENNSVVSPLYVSFSTNSHLIDNFLWYWFKTSEFEQQRQTFSEGGVRDTLSFNQLSNMTFSIPSKEEQEYIGTLFKQLENFITLHQQKIDKLILIKKALLQKMFI